MAHMKSIERLTLLEMINNFQFYIGLPDGLSQLPLPEYLKIKRKKLTIPKDLKEFTDNICYGQRLFLMRKEENDFGSILRVINGYYYSSFKKWDEDKALLFGKYVLHLYVKDLYPVAMHLTTLIGEMAEREQNLLHREPTKIELAAGIEKLNVFSELTALDFLRDAMKCTVPEVLLTPYNECLVRFMLAKEQTDYQERYMNEMNTKAKQHDHK
jgi:hypothetical protein